MLFIDNMRNKLQETSLYKLSSAFQVLIFWIIIASFLPQIHPVYLDQYAFPYDVTQARDLSFEQYNEIRDYTAFNEDSVFTSVVSQIPDACLTRPVYYDPRGEATFKFKSDFTKSVTDCQENNRFTVTFMGIIVDNVEGYGGHANFLLYDKTLQTIERFEPYGLGRALTYDDGKMDAKLKKLFNQKQIKYSVMNNYGVQKHDHIASKGMCVAWSAWFLQFRLLNPDFSIERLNEVAIEYLKKYQYKPAFQLIENTRKNLEEVIKSLPEEVFANIATRTNTPEWKDRVNLLINKKKSEPGRKLVDIETQEFLADWINSEDLPI